MTEIRPRTETAGRTAGWLMLAASVLSVFTMAHHPTGPGGPGLTLANLVHTAMITWLLILFFGMCVLASRRAMGGWMLAGLIGYSVALAANIGAALISGYLFGAIAQAVPDPATMPELFTLLRQANQVLARLGVATTSVAFVLVAVDLIRNVPRQAGAGLLGLLAGLIPALALFSGHLALDVHGALAIYAAQALFTAVLGVQMGRGKL